MGRIKFKINGIEYTVGCEVSSHMTLLDYIRNHLYLKGTKYMCREAGCGACIVNVKPNSTPTQSYAVNSCMVSITSCHNWEITTIEEVGNRNKGYHSLQTTLAKENGSQCGYCSPSWVMSMYSLLQSNPDITMLEIEKSLSSNVCRCTGYRPILQAFKKFAKDAPKSINLPDIEDLRICKKTGESCDKSSCDESDWCIVTNEDFQADIITEIKLKDNRLWFRVNTVRDIFNIFLREKTDSYMLVCGNTAKGVYPIEEYPRVLIDISGVQQLKGYSVDQNLIVNANNTLTEFLNILRTVAKAEYFGYLLKLYDHIKKVAHVAVRNVGSIAGNLMIKHQHNFFSSDIFLLLETVGAQVTIQNGFSFKRSMSMQQFLKQDMRGYVIWNIMLPPLTNAYKLNTFKVMPRSLNAHALINAGFLYKLRNSDNTVQEAKIVFGALSPSFSRATATERFLVGKKLFTDSTLQAALKVLDQEIAVVNNPPEPSVEYRRIAALGLFYKGLIKICPEDSVNPYYSSGAIDLDDERPVSRASQDFPTKPSEWPLNQPITKVEAMIQCAGEAFYTEDLITENEVFCAFALSTIAVGDIVNIDTSKALAHPGVIAVYTAKDIPGINSFTPPDSFLFSANEEVLCSGHVKYFNQPIAIVVADSRHIADKASKLVTATYTNIKAPLLDVRNIRNDKTRTTLNSEVDATDKGNDITNTIKGLNSIHTQYHFVMETLTCVIRPSDEGLDVYCATQWLEGVQLMISRALKIDQNRIDVHTRRCGGAYGIKMSRCIQGAVAAALAVTKLNRPCRFIQSLPINMRAVGKRLPCAMSFDAGVNSRGVIQYLNYNIYEDNGYKVNETFTILGKELFNSGYKKERWNYKSYDSTTDTAKNTFARAPGTLEHIAMTELLMEQIAYHMSLDPLEVRLANLDTEQYGELKEMVDNVIINAEYQKRRAFVDQYNLNNRWKKRGLRFAFLRWNPKGAINVCVNLSAYRGDGTVVITHGCIEMGQGMNTRATQVAAYLLKIPVEKIIVKENNTVIAPNVSLTGGSISSINVCLGVKRACQELLRRLQPIRDQMNNPTWEELIKKAHADNVDLQAHGFTRTDQEFDYPVFGVTLAEVELDVITGQFQILRVDLCQDAGQSINPQIDIGQVEGAFMMGLGYWTCENLIYASTGELLTDRTWNYHVPLARDIPQDWRVSLKKNSYSNEAIFGAKAIGEPPMCMAVVIALALREAVVAARRGAGIPTTQWYEEDGPHTVERNCLLSSTKITDFKYK